MDWQQRVDAWWGARLRLPTAAIQSGGRFAVEHVDHVGVLEVPGRSPLVYGPPNVVAVLDAVPPLRSGTVAGAVAGAVEPRVTQVLGPTWYGYTTDDDLEDTSVGRGVRALTTADLDALDELHRQTPSDEVDESGTDRLPAFGCFDGNQLIAVACVKDVHHMPTIAVLTHPEHRGRGLARRVVAAAARAGLQDRPEVQYRVFHDNVASMSVARACGFTHYADYTVINGTFA
jgi:GNAT superfamily N-acetyltransferase